MQFLNDESGYWVFYTSSTC